MKKVKPVARAKYDGKKYDLWATGKWTYRPGGGERQEVTDQVLIATLEAIVERSKARRAEVIEALVTAAAEEGRGRPPILTGDDDINGFDFDSAPTDAMWGPSNIMKLGDMVTVQGAADILDYHPGSVKNLCRWGKLPGAVKVGRDWLIPVSVVEGYRPGPQGFAAHPELRGRRKARKK